MHKKKHFYVLNYLMHLILSFVLKTDIAILMWKINHKNVYCTENHKKRAWKMDNVKAENYQYIF